MVNMFPCRTPIRGEADLVELIRERDSCISRLPDARANRALTKALTRQFAATSHDDQLDICARVVERAARTGMGASYRGSWADAVVKLARAARRDAPTVFGPVMIFPWQAPESPPYLGNLEKALTHLWYLTFGHPMHDEDPSQDDVYCCMWTVIFALGVLTRKVAWDTGEDDGSVPRRPRPYSAEEVRVWQSNLRWMSGLLDAAVRRNLAAADQARA